MHQQFKYWACALFLTVIGITFSSCSKDENSDEPVAPTEKTDYDLLIGKWILRYNTDDYLPINQIDYELKKDGTGTSLLLRRWLSEDPDSVGVITHERRWSQLFNWYYDKESRILTLAIYEEHDGYYYPDGTSDVDDDYNEVGKEELYQISTIDSYRMVTTELNRNTLKPIFDGYTIFYKQ